MPRIDVNHYPPTLADLLRQLPLAPLGPGKPDATVRASLEALADSTFAQHAVVDRGMAAACRAGLWLAFDHLDESHKISQDIDTPEGSFWHAILHRREPDAPNAVYWFRRVRAHSIFETLATDARALGLPFRSDPWNPFDFIDDCERHRGTGTVQEMLLRQVQQREWELLFDWCFRRAIGKR